MLLNANSIYYCLSFVQSCPHALKAWIHLPGPLVEACSEACNLIAGKASIAMAVLGQQFVFLDSFKSK